MDLVKNKEKLVELLMEFEQCYLKRKKNSSEFDELVMKTASELCIKLNVNHSYISFAKDSKESTAQVNKDASTSKE